MKHAFLLRILPFSTAIVPLLCWQAYAQEDPRGLKTATPKNVEIAEAAQQNADEAALTSQVKDRSTNIETFLNAALDANDSLSETGNVAEHLPVNSETPREAAIAQLAQAEDASEPDEDDAEEAEGETPETEFDAPVEFELNGETLRFTVTGTRNPLRVDELPATVTVFELEDFEFYQVRNLQDLLRYEPGVSVEGALQRYGAQDVNIRGIEGNRVLFQIDNIRLPEQFSFGGLPPGGFRVGRGDYVDFATLQAVEILRGPASTLYGSDALGGVVAYRSLQPSDLIEEGDDFAGDFSTTFFSASGGFDNVARAAVQQDEASAVFVISRRDGSAIDNFGASEFTNSIDTDDTNLYGNFVYSLDETSQLSFILEDINRRSAYNIASGNLATSFIPSLNQLSSNGENRIDRTRASLSYEFDNPESTSFLQFARAQVYYQAATTVETVAEIRSTGSGALGGESVRRDSFNEFIANSYGGDVQFRSDFTTGNWQHRLTYGVDFSETENSRPRDRTQTGLTSGITTSNFGISGTFPEKDFADGDTLRLGLYLQDEISIGDFNLIAGVRFDHYDLQTTDDEAFKGEVASLTASAVSPRIAVLYKATPELSVYGQYARGFRAPLYSEITSGFTNLAFGYETLSNPDLEPETSDSFEVGIRGNFPQLDFGLTGFYNTYDNFIATGQLVGVRPPGILQFQSINIEGARIYGVELTGEYRFSPESHGFSILGSLGYTVGDDLVEDEPLTTVDPLKAVLGLRYRSPNDVWRAELVGTYVGVARVPDDSTLFLPDSYAVLDLIGSYNPIPNLGLTLGVYNLLDTEYYQYSEVRNVGAQADDPGLAQYTQPGINVQFGVSYRF